MAQEAFLPKDELSRDSSSERRDSTPIDISEHRKPVPSDSKSYTVERDGALFAGTHVLVDFWGASKLDDMETVDRALRGAAAAAGATLLHIHLHKFSTNGGISGVAVLAESHISVHTWPELSFAAFDVFMCGACDPHEAVPTLERAFSPDRVELVEQMRGRHG